MKVRKYHEMNVAIKSQIESKLHNFDHEDFQEAVDLIGSHLEDVSGGRYKMFTFQSCADSPDMCAP